MAHSALSITVGIDFTMGKSRERDKQRKKEHNILYCKMCSQRVTILSHFAVSSSLFVFITCGIKDRENESLTVIIGSQTAVKVIRAGTLFPVEIFTGLL